MLFCSKSAQNYGKNSSIFGKNKAIFGILAYSNRKNQFFPTSSEISAHLLPKFTDSGSAIPLTIAFADDSFEVYDIKTMDSALHQKYTGVSNELILENLKYIDSLGCQTEIRVPCVPNINDSEIEKINAFVATLKNSVRTRILEYHDLARSKYKALDIPYTLPEK